MCNAALTACCKMLGRNLLVVAAMAPQAAGDVVAAGCLVVLSLAFDDEEEKEPIAEEASVLECCWTM